MDIIGLSSSIQLSLIIDWERYVRGSSDVYGLIACLHFQWQAQLSHMTQEPTALLQPNV